MSTNSVIWKRNYVSKYFMSFGFSIVMKHTCLHYFRFFDLSETLVTDKIDTS